MGKLTEESRWSLTNKVNQELDPVDIPMKSNKAPDSVSTAPPPSAVATPKDQPKMWGPTLPPCLSPTPGPLPRPSPQISPEPYLPLTPRPLQSHLSSQRLSLPHKAGTPQHSGHQVKLLVYGDSMTHDTKYKLDRLLTSTDDSIVHTFPGHTLENIECEIPQLRGPVDTEFVVIHWGTKNLQIDSPDSIIDKFRSIIFTAQTLMPTSHIIISGIVYRLNYHRTGFNFTRTIDWIHKEVENLCQATKVSFLNNNSTLKNIDKVLKPRDFLHLKMNGAWQLSQNFITATGLIPPPPPLKQCLLLDGGRRHMGHQTYSPPLG